MTDTDVMHETKAWHDKLRQSGVRLTTQRLALCSVLFQESHRHVTAERLHEEAECAGIGVSLATVYNTLHQLVGLGLVRQVTVDKGKSFFDTNTSDHHHYFIEGDGQLLDIPASQIAVSLDSDFAQSASCPENYDIASVDVIVRLKKKQGH